MRPFVKTHPVFVDQLDHGGHVIAFVAVAHVVVAHVPAGGKTHLRILQMEVGLGEIIKAADVVVVHVGQHHVAHLGRIDAEQRQALAGADQPFALALDRHLRQKTGVNDDRTVGIAHQPDEIIHAHGLVMRVAADKMVSARTDTGGVTDGKHFIIFQG